MIELDRALEIVLGVAARPQIETVGLERAMGRVLAREVLSPIDSPPFDKSAMDGFAVAEEERSTELVIVETVAAGERPARSVGPGECSRIMTGAMLPPGTGRVIRREYVSEADGRIRILTQETGDNVIRRGASLRAGACVVGPKVLAAQDVGALASSGIARVEVAIPPRVTVLCTGPEIRAAGQPLGAGEIYDSNGPQLRAQLRAMECAAEVRSGIEDRRDLLTAAMEDALRSNDLLLLTGGVSAGDFDWVPSCLQDMGARILFHKVSVKPGKPVLFASRGGQYIFGLPGNPVSTFVMFEVLVKPFLYRLMGLDWRPRFLSGTLTHAVRRAEVKRTEFLPVRVRNGLVQAVSYHGSAHVNALAEADALLRIEIGVREIAEGTLVHVRSI